ncbi:MAG TPA: hypothetical protein VM492_00075 [Sumerlaeia bacterium]|nr:hypothetical protein [Sumerlaeia bacterium]
MSKKDVPSEKGHEVFGAMRSLMTGWAAQRAAVETGVSSVPYFVSFRQERQGGAPDSLGITQFYFERYGKADRETLEALPEDMFIVC